MKRAKTIGLPVVVMATKNKQRTGFQRGCFKRCMNKKAKKHILSETLPENHLRGNKKKSEIFNFYSKSNLYAPLRMLRFFFITRAIFLTGYLNKTHIYSPTCTDGNQYLAG